jgi:hypothetical protein
MAIFRNQDIGLISTLFDDGDKPIVELASYVTLDFAGTLIDIVKNARYGDLTLELGTIRRAGWDLLSERIEELEPGKKTILGYAEAGTGLVFGLTMNVFALIPQIAFGIVNNYREQAINDLSKITNDLSYVTMVELKQERDRINEIDGGHIVKLPDEYDFLNHPMDDFVFRELAKFDGDQLYIDKAKFPMDLNEDYFAPMNFEEIKSKPINDILIDAKPNELLLLQKYGVQITGAGQIKSYFQPRGQIMHTLATGQAYNHQGDKISPVFDTITRKDTFLQYAHTQSLPGFYRAICRAAMAKLTEENN